MASNLKNHSHLIHPVTLKDIVRSWLKEDTPNFDYGGFVVGEKLETAKLLCKSKGILAGTTFFDAIFEELGCTVSWSEKEGSLIEPIKQIATISGKVRHLLIGERVALNCLCRVSGIATYANQLKQLADKHKWHGEVAGTRKTTPGFRLPEKYGLIVGGISTHRYDLSGMVMLKDNHIWSAGNVTRAVKDARSVCGFSQKIEVECRSLEDAFEAVDAGADIIMLDNFLPEALHKSAKLLKEKYPHVIVEASGGINEETITSYFGPHVDVISLSKTTQGYSTVDFSFKILKDGHDPENPLVTA